MVPVDVATGKCLGVEIAYDNHPSIQQLSLKKHFRRDIGRALVFVVYVRFIRANFGVTIVASWGS